MVISQITTDANEVSVKIIRTASSPPDGGTQAWLQVLAYFTISLGTLGVQYAFGVLYAELLDALGGTPSETALIGSLCIGMMDGSAILSGLVIARLGPRYTALIGTVLTITGMAVSATATTTWHLTLSYGILVGFGHGLVFFAPIGLMRQWFTTRLTRAHALGNMGGALTPLVISLVAPDAFATIGWQQSLLYFAVAELVLLLPAALLLKLPPAAAAAAAASSTNASNTSPPTRVPARPFYDAYRRPPVLLLAAGLFCHGCGSWTSIVHVVRIGVERGMTLKEASSLLLLLLSIGSAALRVPVAAVADRIGKHLTFALLMLIQALMAFLCSSTAAWAASPPFLGTFAFFIGGLVGAANSTMVAMPSELALPGPTAGAATAIIVTTFGIGTMVGPLVAGALRSSTMDYTAPMIFAGCALLMAALLALTLLFCSCARRQGTHVPKTPSVVASNLKAGHDNLSAEAAESSASN